MAILTFGQGSRKKKTSYPFFQSAALEFQGGGRFFINSSSAQFLVVKKSHHTVAFQIGLVFEAIGCT